MFALGIPLLIVPFAIYNMIAFLMPGVSWTGTLTTVRVFSGAEWSISVGDLLLTASILILFLEILKATRLGNRSLVDHVLSLLLFLAMMAEFLLVQQAATSVFFLLGMLSFIDVIGGFAITLRTAQRAVTVDAAERVVQA
jgi:hypothetical protein